MIDPIIFRVTIGGFEFALHWYGVIAVISILIGTWLAEREMKRRGEDPEHLWEGLVWAIPAGIIGARLWYVINDILGGSPYYVTDPSRIVKIWEGGLHWYGGMLFAGLAFYIYARRFQVDMRLILDSVAPSLLIGQGIARLGNFINQELYGPPTSLPWGIRIDAPYRNIPPWNDLVTYPVETTRFHPAFAYEMLWNFVCAGLLLWIGRRYEKKLKPGIVFAGWLILAGIGRVWLESFRPDQPRVPGTDLSYTRIVAAGMVLAGVFIVLLKYRVIRLPFLSPGTDEYNLSPRALAAAAGELGGTTEAGDAEEIDDESGPEYPDDRHGSDSAEDAGERGAPDQHEGTVEESDSVTPAQDAGDKPAEV